MATFSDRTQSVLNNPNKVLIIMVMEDSRFVTAAGFVDPVQQKTAPKGSYYIKNCLVKDAGLIDMDTIWSPVRTFFLPISQIDFLFCLLASL